MNDIENRLIEIVDLFVNGLNLDLRQKIILNKALHIIMSHSQQAITFISSVEDEFTIEFEDEEISLDVFLNFDLIVGLIKKHFD